MFDSIDPKQKLPELEEGILQYWREEDIFKRSVNQRSAQSSYSFYDGPPFATGLPHYGHLLAGTIKDVIPRYQTMRGKKVVRRFGWDCHGLPIENLIEQEHEIKDKKQIEEMGVGTFNDLCRGSVQRYTKEWREVVERMGRWVDMDWDYRTMDPEYMESIWWGIKQLNDKGLLYEGKKSMHVCPRCVTPLSNFEVTLGYKDVVDFSITLKFQTEDDADTYFLAWTTTPWCLPGQIALTVGPDIKYQKVKLDDEFYWCAKSRVSEMVPEGYDVVEEATGKELEGKSYNPLFPYNKDKKQESEWAFKIIMDDYVSDEDGTGFVTTSPDFGEDDMRICRSYGIPFTETVEMDGTFRDKVTDFAGMNVKPADDLRKTDRLVVKKLEDEGKMLKTSEGSHSYPHCWRCDTPLLNYSTSSWFVAVEKIKEQILKANARTEWVPSHLRDGRFGKWLENARDWAISRNRYWGTPLPIWINKDTDDKTVIGSRDDLMVHKKIRFTKVTALRHAESEGNVIPIYQGEMPGTDLTSKGKKQAKEVGSWLKTQKVDVVYASPLARCKQTADIIAKKTGAKVIVDERLREVNFGEYEGKTVDFTDLSFITARRAHKLKEDSPESIYHFDGMEPWENVQERVSSFLSEMLPKHRSEHIVVVTHADPLSNMRHFFTKEDPVKLSHQPYPEKANPYTFFWDHDKEARLDLHKDTVDDLVWPGSQSDKSVTVTMVRHGETDWNVEKKIQGSTKEVPLNEKGKEQTKELAKKLKGKKFDLIISSDADRAIESAKILSDKLGIPFEDQWTTLQERRYYSWMGRTKDEVFGECPMNDHMKQNGGTFPFHHATPQEGESLSDFIIRMQEVYEALLEKYAGKHILLVSHNGVAKALKALAENLSYPETLKFGLLNAGSATIKLNPLIRRTTEVLDCWVESGSMPFAQGNYPFRFVHSKQKEPQDFPADFIAEGMDQTRGWFYTLTVLSTALFGKSPFENCVVNGTVLSEDGRKMSKKLQNYPDPMDVVHSHGADAVRFALMSSPAVRGEDLRFSEKLVEDTVRNVLLPLWNTYSFFVTYANAAKYEPHETRRHSNHPLDSWMRAEVQDLVNRMTEELDRYDLSATCDELHDTIDALTNWYVRLSRRRFAGKGSEEAPDASGDRGLGDQHDAVTTLYDVLLTVGQLLAPFCPYITDAIYLNLVPETHGSIHLTDWPQKRELTDEEKKLLKKTRLMRLIVSLGLSIRSEANVKVRQPLNLANIALPPEMASSIQLSDEDLALLRQELNVKEIAFADDPEQLAEAYVQVDARKVGPRLGARVQEVIQAGKSGDFTQKDDGSILILDEVMSPAEAQIVYRGKEGDNVAADKGVVVSIDTSFDDELRLEGEARDIIRAVQRLRKENGLSFTDRISLKVNGADEVMQTHGELIADETRADISDNDGDENEVDLPDRKIIIAFEKRA